MKNLFLSAALALLSLLMYAPGAAAQGAWVLGGSINFTTQENGVSLAETVVLPQTGGPAIIYDQTRSRSFTFAPYIGGEWRGGRWMMALRFLYGSSKFTAEDALVFTTPFRFDIGRNGRQLGTGIFMRYAFNPGNDFRVFLQPAVSYRRERYEDIQNGDITREEEIRSVELALGFGALYAFSPRMRATLNIGGLSYLAGNWEIENSTVGRDFSVFNFDLNLASIRIGIETRF
jgi:hypothetical protein